MLNDVLKTIIAEQRQQNVPKQVIINSLREYIQYVILSEIYNSRDYKKMIFKGGSCLRIGYDLPRLSEDLDFDYLPKALVEKPLISLAEYLYRQIKNKQFNRIEIKTQSDSRLYLKFPILYGLGLNQKPEIDKLYVKIEAEDEILPYAGIIFKPVAKFGFNFLARTYDLPTLMAGKIYAFLNRVWFKGKKQEINIKGRDFYDLWWFFDKKVTPNWKTLKKTTEIKDEKSLKRALKDRIKKTITPRKLAFDLQNFISDQEFVFDFAKNYREIISRYL